jgi:hypothetical protein
MRSYEKLWRVNFNMRAADSKQNTGVNPTNALDAIAFKILPFSSSRVLPAFVRFEIFLDSTTRDLPEHNYERHFNYR